MDQNSCEIQVETKIHIQNFLGHFNLYIDNINIFYEFQV